jgi:hypothetical protein
MEKSGEHLECGGLSRAVGTQEADALTWLDLERDVVDGAHVSVSAVEQRTYARPQARLFHRNPVDLGELADFDQGDTSESWASIAALGLSQRVRGPPEGMGRRIVFDA